MAIGYDYSYQQEIIRLCRLNKRGGAFWSKYTKVAAALIRLIWPCDIDPNATIGRISIPHAVGIVIGETAVVEDDVIIMSGVVIGNKNGNNGKIRHAHVCKGALLGANCVILGPVRIGENATVGAGSVVTKDVPDNAVVVGINRIIEKKGDIENE